MAGAEGATTWDGARVGPIPGRWRVEFHPVLDSTNDEVLRDPVPGRVVVADTQRSGRGRLARTWVTPPGLALAVSALVPAPDPALLGWVPLATGLAVRAALADVGVDAELKWPNDVLLAAGPHAGRKLAGILIQAHRAGLVIGTGINVALTEADLPVPTATSVLLAGGDPDRELVLARYLVHLDRVLALLDTDPVGVQGAYRRACGTLGRAVEVHDTPGDPRRGRALEIDPSGRLVLDLGGRRYAVSAGDVIHVREG